MVPVLRGAEGHAAFAQRRVLNTILCVPAAENIVRTAAHTRKSSCGSGKPHPNFGPSKGLRRRVWPAVTGAWVQETADNGEERTEQGGWACRPSGGLGRGERSLSLVPPVSEHAAATSFTVPSHLLSRVFARVEAHTNLCERVNVNVVVRCYYFGRNTAIRAADGHPGV